MFGENLVVEPALWPLAVISTFALTAPDSAQCEGQGERASDSRVQMTSLFAEACAAWCSVCVGLYVYVTLRMPALVFWQATCDVFVLRCSDFCDNFIVPCGAFPREVYVGSACVRNSSFCDLCFSRCSAVLTGRNAFSFKWVLINVLGRTRGIIVMWRNHSLLRASLRVHCSSS